jgi:hypothetical protein
MERRLSAEGVGEAYHEGATKHLNHAASLLTLAGAGVIAGPGRRSRAAARRPARSGACGAASSAGIPRATCGGSP